MNNRDTHLEVLINRYLDGEITAREMEDLRALVDGDGQAKDLFEQMQQLHHLCQEAVQTHVLQSGRPIEDLISNAWQGHRYPLWIGPIKRAVFSQFSAGMAAGLLIGVFVYTALTSLRPTPLRSPHPVTASSTSPRETAPSPTSPEDTTPEEALPQVNLYYYTDSQGNRWVIEGLSEERVRNVAYQGGF